MGCSSSINKIKTPVPLNLNQLIDVIIKDNKFKKYMNKGIAFQGEKYIYNNVEFEADNINFYPNLMIKFTNLKVLDLDQYYCIKPSLPAIRQELEKKLSILF